jgi:hypothetical protein
VAWNQGMNWSIRLLWKRKILPLRVLPVDEWSSFGILFFVESRHDWKFVLLSKPPACTSTNLIDATADMKPDQKYFIIRVASLDL